MAKDSRFVKTYSQGHMEGNEIWVDHKTGVNYFYHFAGSAAGLTPLLSANGMPIVTAVERED